MCYCVLEHVLVRPCMNVDFWVALHITITLFGTISLRGGYG